MAEEGIQLDEMGRAAPPPPPPPLAQLFQYHNEHDLIYRVTDALVEILPTKNSEGEFHGDDAPEDTNFASFDSKKDVQVTETTTKNPTSLSTPSSSVTYFDPTDAVASLIKVPTTTYMVTLAKEKGGIVVGQARRRYSQFAILRETLRLRYPGLLLPVLPPKSILRRGSTTEFQKTRARGLARFLNRLLVIPFLDGDKSLARFIDKRFTTGAVPAGAITASMLRDSRVKSRQVSATKFGRTGQKKGGDDARRGGASFR